MSGRGFVAGDGGGGLSGEPALHAGREESDIGRLVIEAGHVLECLAAGMEKLFAAFAGDLFEGFETVGDKSGRYDDEALFTFGGEALELFVGVGLEPGFAGDAGLERDRPGTVGQAGAARESVGGFGDLGLVAHRVGGVAGGAAIGLDRAVRMRGVALAEVAHGDAVVGKEDVVVRLVEVGARDGVEGFDVIGVLEERLHAGDAHGGGKAAGFGVNFYDDGFPRRHSVVGVLGEEEELLDAVGGDGGEHVSDGWVTVAHGEVNRGGWAEGGGELVADLIGGRDERGAFFGPHLFVGLGGFRGADGGNDDVDEELGGPAGFQVDDALVAEKLFEVATHVGDGGGSGGTEVDEEDGALGHSVSRIGHRFGAHVKRSTETGVGRA